MFCVPDQGLCVRSPGRATTPVSFRRLAEDIGLRSMRSWSMSLSKDRGLTVRAFRHNHRYDEDATSVFLSDIMPF